MQKSGEYLDPKDYEQKKRKLSEIIDITRYPNIRKKKEPILTIVIFTILIIGILILLFHI